MISDRDVWASANVLIKRYGADAKDQAIQRADDLLREGDLEGQAVWKRIIRAIDELQREKPNAGEPIN